MTRIQGLLSATLLIGLGGVLLEYGAIAQEGVVIPLGGISVRPAQADGETPKIFAGPDPAVLSAMFELLDDSQVRTVLKLSKPQIEGLKKVQRNLVEVMAPLNNFETRDPGFPEEFQKRIAERKKIAEIALEEILLPEQFARLNQLMYRIEITNLGWSNSLVSGRLGTAVGVYENQYTHLKDRIAQITAETERKIATLRQEAEQQILLELTPEQRKQAAELIGDFVEYRPLSFVQEVVERRRLDEQ